VKVIRKPEQVVIHLGQREKKLLFELLKLYPRIPPAHHKLSKTRRLPEPEANQKLLEEALAEGREENKKQLMKLMTDPARYQESSSGCKITLSMGDLEWLLQVINDIRVGSWILLGQPEEKFDPSMLNEKNGPNFWAMELAGQFQMALLGHA